VFVRQDSAVSGLRLARNATSGWGSLNASPLAILSSSTQTQTEQQERAHILAGQLGNDLSEVSFIMDYLGIEFHGPGPNLYVWPRIHRSSKILARPDSGYADSLIALIGTQLSAVDELFDNGLTLDFVDGTRLAPAE
jgi:hypothetical protein